MATMNPVTKALRPKLCWMELTAPLMTEESKPKRNPPTAAAMARPITLRRMAPVGVASLPGSSTDEEF